MKYYRLRKSVVSPFGTIPAGTVSVFEDDMYRFGDGVDCFRFSEEHMIEQVGEKPDWFEEVEEPESQEEELKKGDAVYLGEDGKYHKAQYPEKEECKHEHAKYIGTVGGISGINGFVCPDCPDNTWKILPGCKGSEPQPKQDCSHKNVVTWCGDCENVIYKPLPSAEGFYADNGLEESAKCQDALNKAHCQKQEQSKLQELEEELREGKYRVVADCLCKQEQPKPSEWIKERAKALCIEESGRVTNWKDYLSIATRDLLDSVAEGKYKL